ncbi:aminotransferase class I/II-fold pyridoxal phosphate-dependent enzyme [Candidatus Binatia bacterium]|nr:aminotransferase class I/II-fold pyridoxal phosphate-dependent enzyme [Candidatus Binatia bacterium]
MTIATTEQDGAQRLAALRAEYDSFRARGLALDMTRGKPCAEQLDLSLGLLDGFGREFKAADGTDCRNYGVVEGLPEARALFAELLEVEPAQIVVGGNSSLALMHDVIVQALLKGTTGGPAWYGQKPKFLCPSPGYDRHFAICERYAIEMLPVAMRGDGPDMDEVERLVASDASLKGMWCVPRYSNPGGVVYSRQVVERLAAMRTAAPDFRILWDNAYAVHHLVDDPPPLANLIAACAAAGNPDRAIAFTSTSKITFAGAGIAALASSVANVRHLVAGLSIQTIGHDKLSQLRHARFFGDAAGVAAHMRKHAAILKPKFEAVTAILAERLGGKGVATWSNPAGGYFVSLDTPDGCAARVVKMADEAGVKLTKAGATYPYGKDPRDRNIRLAPSFPPLAQVRQAMELVAICVEIAALERASA